MYQLQDIYNDTIFAFRDEAIFDRDDNKIGIITNGKVCDLDGTPTRVTVEGENVVWHGVNPGPVIGVPGFGNVVVETDSTAGKMVNLVGIIVGASSNDERMIAAVAYWEFVESRT